MPSPFPGMNPFFERSGVWEEFHQNFISRCQEHLVAQAPPRYRVRSGARLYIHEPPHTDRFFGISDISLHRPRIDAPASEPAASVVAPVYATLPETVEIQRIPYVAIEDRAGGEFVTVIELLSPTNKYAGPDREQYLGKRRELLRSQTHLVELDMLRGGPRMPLDAMPFCAYCAVVSRVEERPRVGVWPWNLRDPMPGVPIPLRSPDADLHLDLKFVLDQVYDAFRYGDVIYTGPPEPRLAPDDAAWAAPFIPA